MRALLIGAVLVGACTTPPSVAGTPTPSSPFSVSFGASPTFVAGTPSPPSIANFAEDQTAQWPVVLYEWDGSVIRQRTESANTEIARPCAGVRRLEARPAGLLAWCHDASSDLADLVLISIPDGRVTPLASGIRASWSADISPDGRSVAAFRTALCLPGPPVCQTRAVLIDVASKTEREIVPSGYPLGATLEWTALGLTFFQPECAEAGCAGTGDKGGTFVWDGTAFKRWSELRFVAKSGDWTLLERMRSFGQEPRTVIARGPQGEMSLSAGHALSISDKGEALVYVPGERLVRFGPDGKVLWQASFTPVLLKILGPDALLAVSPTGTPEMYDTKRVCCGSGFPRGRSSQASRASEPAPESPG
jgi:hypothetical protein